MGGGVSEVVKHLIIINCIFWIGTIAFGGAQVFENIFAFHHPDSSLFRPWQVVTHMFMHAGYVGQSSGVQHIYFQHLLFNMFGLWMFGTPVERVLGVKKFLFFYFSAGFGALILHAGWGYFRFEKLIDLLIQNDFERSTVLSMLQKGNYYPIWKTILGEAGFSSLFLHFRSVLLGASGAIMGVLVAFGVLFPNVELMLLFIPIPIKAKFLIPAIVLLDLFSMLTGYSLFSPSNTAYLAHLGGALFGFLMIWYWKKNGIIGSGT